MEDVLIRTSDESREIVGEFRKKIQGLGRQHRDKIQEHTGEHWIGWRSEKHDRVFAEMRPLQGRVQVFILPRKRDLKDPGGLARAAPPTQGWGWFRTRFDVSSLRQVEPAFRLIRQSYERGLNGHAARGARRKRIV